jgi:hypothetical protein
MEFRIPVFQSEVEISPNIEVDRGASVNLQVWPYSDYAVWLKTALTATGASFSNRHPQH